MRNKMLGGVAALTLVLTSGLPAAGVAQAADGSPDPQQLQEAIDFFYAAPADEWSPQGTVIADSGFDPAYEAFPFINYGNTFGNNVLLGYPMDDPVVNLTSVEAQQLYGVKEACTSGSGKDCVLTPPMMAWITSLNSSTFSGGHCFGIAALVAGLFDGVVSRAGLTPSLVNAGVALSPAVQRKIAELFITQLSLTEAQTRANMLPPDQLVNQLIQFLPSGQLPYILTLFWKGENGQTEGHGITPYAVYSKGPGLVDIAVYDNNYPLRGRAVHVDLNENTWEYEVFATPGQTPTIASGDAESLNLGLVPLNQVFQPQDCRLCYGAPEGTSMALVVPLTDDADKLSVDFFDPNGKPITVRSLSVVPLPNVVEVPSSGRYTMRIRTSGKVKDTAYEVAVFGPGESMTVFVSSGRSGVADIDVDLVRDSLTVATTSDAQAFMTAVERDRRAIDGSMSVVSLKPYPKRSANTDMRTSEAGHVQRVDYLGTAPLHVAVAAQRVSPATGAMSASAKVVLRKGDRVSTDLSTWRQGVPPEFVLRHADGTTRVLTTELIGPAEYVTAVYEQPFG